MLVRPINLKWLLRGQAWTRHAIRSAAAAPLFRIPRASPRPDSAQQPQQRPVKLNGTSTGRQTSASSPLSKGEVVMKVGKHQGRTFAEIYSEDGPGDTGVGRQCGNARMEESGMVTFAAYVQHRWLLSIHNLLKQARPDSLKGQRLVSFSDLLRSQMVNFWIYDGALSMPLSTPLLECIHQESSKAVSGEPEELPYHEVSSVHFYYSSASAWLHLFAQELHAHASSQEASEGLGAMLEGPYGSAYSFFLTVVILVNVASFILSTEQEMEDYRGVFDKIETGTVCIFSIEYVLRFSTRAGTCMSRLRWMGYHPTSTGLRLWASGKRRAMFCCTEACGQTNENTVTTQADGTFIVDPGNVDPYTVEPPKEEKQAPEPIPEEEDALGQGEDLGNNHYKITFRKPAEDLTGVTLEKVDGLLVITEFEEDSLIGKWNSSRPSGDPLAEH
eukprot:Skav213910  [mRNA]  locus=scaffold1439:213536:224696:- [translate_table: standard]